MTRINGEPAYGSDPSSPHRHPIRPGAPRPGQVVRLPHGLVGFEDRTRFVLARLPERRLDGFRLLRSLEDSGLSFMLLPLDPDAGLIDAAGLDEARRQAGVDRADARYYLVVTARRENGALATTVNLRAPIVLDAARRAARQTILSSDRYAIRHPI